MLKINHGDRVKIGRGEKVWTVLWTSVTSADLKRTDWRGDDRYRWKVPLFKLTLTKETPNDRQ